MIAIKVKDEFLDLYPDTELSIVLRSSFIENKDLVLSYMIPFTLPATDQNNKIFSFVNEIPISVLEFKEQAQLFIENQPYKMGLLKVREWSDREYIVEIEIEVSQFIEDLTQPISTLNLAYRTSSIEDMISKIKQSTTATWEYGFACPEVFVPEFLNGFEGLSKNYTWKWLNMWDSEKQDYNYHNGLRIDMEYFHTPMFFTKYVLDLVQKKLGFRFDGTFWESEVLNELLIFNNRLIEFLLPTDLLIFGWEVVIKPIITIHEHLPKDMTPSDLMRQLANMFCLYMRYDEVARTIKIEFKKDLLSETNYIDYTDKLVKGYQGKRAENINTGLKYSDNIFPAYVPPHCDKFIEIEASTLPCDFASDNTHTKRILPIYHGQASADYSWGISTDYIDKLYFLFWRGLENGEDGKPYPRAFFQGKLDSASTALSLFGSPLSLYDLYWKDYLDFLNNAKKVKFSLLFTVADLLNFDIYKKIRVLDVVYVINSVEITLTMQGMYLAELECYTVVSTYAEPCSKEVTVIIDKEECSKEVTAILEPDNNTE